ncbi:biopolymer transporter ExbB [Amylibacter sp. IMCC11727]|uniref:biopolymer transporter ExbB n=1 Tax=Amylibacter sp. IMCC11727 TaxID=3039851 RepID=UPI00244DE366|nr:biopolymer transporter ExbB [Amylibacter sp. IMCC11727]WGI22553.1 biopolymer transporter ExbB [Amylibacter sp. IMCC11727]
MMLQADRKADPHFTQPVRQILMMLMFVVMVTIGAFLSYQSLLPIFMANVLLNGFIMFVFVFGIIACFWQVFTLVSSVSWIEGFALDRPGHEFVDPPGLLAPLAHLLRKRGARTSLTSTSTQSIQDSVATRLDEGREITRYVINLLIFLGLLGTFYGLAVTVPAVVDTIRSLAPQEGANSMDVFDNLMTGLERQLGGMGTAFGSSLLGLAGSLVVGLLDLLAGRGQNRFYRELEEWLSSITRIGVGTSDGDMGNVENFAIADMLEHTTYQIENLHDLLRQSQERRNETDKRVARLTQVVERLAESTAQAQGSGDKLVEQIAYGQKQMIDVMQNGQKDEVWDAEAKMRLRNIDTQLLRILEEMTAGRQDAVSDLRSDLLGLTSTLRKAIGVSSNSGDEG